MAAGPSYNPESIIIWQVGNETQKSTFLTSLSELCVCVYVWL